MNAIKLTFKIFHSAFCSSCMKASGMTSVLKHFSHSQASSNCLEYIIAFEGLANIIS